MEQSKDQGAAVRSEAVAEAPHNPYSDHLAPYWQAGFDGGEICATTRGNALAAYGAGIAARSDTVAGSEPTAAEVYKQLQRANSGTTMYISMGVVEQVMGTAKVLAGRAADAPSDLATLIEPIFTSWDGCDFDGIDIGAALRADFKTFVFGKSRAADALDSQPTDLRRALVTAEAALADIGDADREPGDDVAWCEARAAQALPAVRAALASQPAASASQSIGDDEEFARLARVWDEEDDDGDGWEKLVAYADKWFRSRAPAAQAASVEGCSDCLHTYCLSGEICTTCGDVNGMQGYKGGKSPQQEGSEAGNGCDLKAVHDFLMGESPLEGVQFGGKHPTKAGAFWWRLNLRAALAKG